jgi:AcrR family transcriptional regulator
MSPRPYSLGKREANVQETRRRILDAAKGLILEAGFHHASVGDIAARADVTRATIYHQFDSKIGLLAAVLTDTLERGGLERVSRLGELSDARAMLDAAIRDGVRLWATEPELFRKLVGLAEVDPSAAEAVGKRDGERRGFMAYLAMRLDEQGVLRPGVDREQAQAVLTLLTSFATFDSLHAISGLSVDATGEVLLDLASALVLQPPQPSDG